MVMCRVPSSGHAWNPLKYPPNMLCLCASGKKFKKCCGPHIPEIIPEEVAKQMSAEKNPLAQFKVMLKWLDTMKTTQKELEAKAVEAKPVEQ